MNFLKRFYGRFLISLRHCCCWFDCWILIWGVCHLNGNLWVHFYFSRIWICLKCEISGINVCFFSMGCYIWIFWCFLCDKFFVSILQWFLISLNFFNLVKQIVVMFFRRNISFFFSESLILSLLSLSWYFNFLICSNNFLLRSFKHKFSSYFFNRLSLIFLSKPSFSCSNLCFLVLHFLTCARSFSLWFLRCKISSLHSVDFAWNHYARSLYFFSEAFFIYWSFVISSFNSLICVWVLYWYYSRVNNLQHLGQGIVRFL